MCVQVKKQLTKKYGKEFVEKAEQDEGGLVNERVKRRLDSSVSTAVDQAQPHLLSVITHNFLLYAC